MGVVGIKYFIRVHWKYKKGEEYLTTRSEHLNDSYMGLGILLQIVYILERKPAGVIRYGIKQLLSKRRYFICIIWQRIYTYHVCDTLKLYLKTKLYNIQHRLFRNNNKQTMSREYRGKKTWI